MKDRALSVAVIAVLALGSALLHGCARYSDARIIPSGLATESIDRASTARLGDVVTLQNEPYHFCALAWDATDRVLIGTQGSSYPGRGPVVILGPSNLFKLPASATGVAFDPSRRTFYFSSGHALYASKAGGALSTVSSSIGQAGMLAVDETGNVYVVDVDHIDRYSGGKLVVFSVPGTVSGGPAAGPWGYPSLAFRSKDRALYLADTYGVAIKRILPNGNATLVSGGCKTIQCTFGDWPGHGQRASFGPPSGIVYDAQNDDLMFTDAYNNQLWKLNASGDAQPVAGYGPQGDYDGNGWHAFFTSPLALAYAPDLGATFVSDATRIAKYTASGPTPAPEASPTLRFPVPRANADEGSPAVDATGAWFVVKGVLQHVRADGSIKSYRHMGLQNLVAEGGSGNVWMTDVESRGTTSGIVRLDTSGRFTRFRIPGPAVEIGSLIVGPDGHPWFFSKGRPVSVAPAIGTVRAGKLVLYPLTGPKLVSFASLASGPDGLLWYIDGANRIDRLTTSGIAMKPVSLHVTPLRLAFNARAEDVWFTTGASVIYRVSKTRHVARFKCAVCSTGVVDMAASPTDSVWLLAPCTSALTRATQSCVFHHVARGVLDRRR